MHNWNDQRALQIIEDCVKKDKVLTTALRKLVDHFGYIDDAAIAPLAKSFLRSKAEVYGVICYYADFRQQAPGRNILRICQAEACQAVGGRKLTKSICQKTNLELGQTAKDGSITIEAVYCLGLCANGPAAELNQQPLAELDEEKVSTILRDLS